MCRAGSYRRRHGIESIPGGNTAIECQRGRQGRCTRARPTITRPRACCSVLCAPCSREVSFATMIRVAISQFRPLKGDYAHNVARIGAVLTQASRLDPPPQLVVFPEAATSGYFVEGGVKEVAVTAGTLVREDRKSVV